MTRLMHGTGAGAHEFQENLRRETELMQRFLLLREQANAIDSGPLKSVPGALPQAPSIDTAALERIRQQLDATRDRLGGTTQSLMFSYLYGTSTPTAITDEFVNAMARVDDAVRRGAITAEQATRMKRDLALQEQGYILDTASMAAQTLTAVFQKNKVAASAAAGINTAVAITKALQLPWPFNWVQAGLVAAQGAAQIASINSASDKSGGSVAGIGGGGDSSGGAGAAPPPDAGRALHITGVDRASLYSGDALERIIEGINDAVQNGYTLISTRNLRV
jgi:polyhydroxyalkanoate synthesis regulator phasin